VAACHSAGSGVYVVRPGDREAAGCGSGVDRGFDSSRRSLPHPHHRKISFEMMRRSLCIAKDDDQIMMSEIRQNISFRCNDAHRMNSDIDIAVRTEDQTLCGQH